MSIIQVFNPLPIIHSKFNLFFSRSKFGFKIIATSSRNLDLLMINMVIVWIPHYLISLQWEVPIVIRNQWCKLMPFHIPNSSQQYPQFQAAWTSRLAIAHHQHQAVLVPLAVKRVSWATMIIPYSIQITFQQRTLILTHLRTPHRQVVPPMRVITINNPYQLQSHQIYHGTRPCVKF